MIRGRRTDGRWHEAMKRKGSKAQRMWRCRVEEKEKGTEYLDRERDGESRIRKNDRRHRVIKQKTRKEKG